MHLYTCVGANVRLVRLCIRLCICVHVIPDPFMFVCLCVRVYVCVNKYAFFVWVPICTRKGITVDSCTHQLPHTNTQNNAHLHNEEFPKATDVQRNVLCRHVHNYMYTTHALLCVHIYVHAHSDSYKNPGKYIHMYAL